MELAELLMWYAIALLTYGVWSTIYRMNPLYDIAEGISIGAATARALMDNSVTLNSAILIPLQKDLGANWWMFLSVIYGLCYFFLYTRRYIEIFRFVSGVTLAISLANVVRTNATAIWSQVTRSAMIFDIGFFVLWVVFILGLFYFIYGRKVERYLAIPREAGRWVMVFSLGALLTPMFIRYLEDLVGWSTKIKDSPAWWIPYVIFAVIAVDALNRKYKFLGKPKEIEAKA